VELGEHSIQTEGDIKYVSLPGSPFTKRVENGLEIEIIDAR
jgi:hypothetical protein